MSEPTPSPPSPVPPGSAPPRIPAPPPRAARKRGPGGGARPLIWMVALGLGIAAGVLAYRELADLAFYFDYWVALAFS